MKNLLFVFILFSIGCTKPTSECVKLDNNEAKQVIVDYYQALSDRNFVAVKTISTPDFIIYDLGLVWNNDSLINLVKSMPEATFTFEVKEFNFETDCNSVFLNYLNHGIFNINDTTRLEYHWLESGYVKKVGEELKLNFLHSTEAK